MSALLAAAALLATGLAAPAQAMRAPSEAAAGGDCAVGSHARVKRGYHGVDPNSLTSAEMRRAQQQLQKRLARLGYGARRTTARSGPILVRVRWHVIQADDGSGNVTNARIRQQLKVMNDGFAGRTARAAVHTPFRFVTVKIDRTRNSDWYDWSDPSSDPSDDIDAKAALGVNPQKQLNVYIAALGDGLLGYATYPWETDLEQGLVILNDSMPGGSAAPYNEGDTATHEIGHWLGLAHTFDNGCAAPGDYVKDTPYQDDGDNIFFCNESDDTCTKPGTDPVHNFMSYGDDPCLDQFTRGQSRRMVAQWIAWRGHNT